jgi:hypothetical protein
VRFIEKLLAPTRVGVAKINDKPRLRNLNSGSRSTLAVAFGY